ncbi:hypothetical protein J1G42_00570 [Cellulomonas sp. zg-ZUI222]|uniref:DUF4352 domain-containing protein n=1 Tax=Cellulomonas wangleii TaxID=2816956 RepID=A0ABX8D5Z4_9CELL|nr:hypothetical protein [Cellulomonas wangleii]MBO0919319.1 hypothetical protein [Cellulomonas wangleii]MBO0924535.1 hypothetical protein [Cellulomonas wangleii]QVI62521.1 hypothetical protein KG103_00745 [Cellulomonas wangleii]
MTLTAPSARPARAARPRRLHRVVVGLAAATLLVAPGCAAGASADAGPTTATAHAGAEVTFGTPFEYADGLLVDVTAPARFTPTAQAEWDRAVPGVLVRVRVSITNGTDAEFRPNTLIATAVSGGQDAVAVLDPGSQIGQTGPDAAVPAGGSVAFPLAFLVQDPADVRLTVEPALGGYEPLVLTVG